MSATRKRLRLFETLERRNFLSGFGLIVQEALPDRTVTAGTQDVPVAKAQAMAFGGSLVGIAFAPQRGFSTQAVEDFDLRADVFPLGRPDGNYETVLARDVRPAANGSVNFSVIPWYFGVKPMPIMVTADIRPDAASSQVKLGQAVGRMVSGTVYTVGAMNPTVTVTAAKLAITEQAGPATDTAVSSEKNVTFARMQMTAEGGDKLLTALQVSAAQGQIQNATNWSLWADTDSNGAVDTKVGTGAASGTSVNFALANGGSVIRSTTAFEARADIASSLAGDRLQVTVSAASAERMDGAGAGVTIAHTAQTLWSLVPQGNVFVSGSTTPVASHDALGGTLSDDLLRMRVRSEFETADVTYIGIDAAGQAASIDRIELFVAGQNTPFAVATVANANVGDTFGASMTTQNLLIPEGDTVEIIARARVRSDIDGGISGHQFALAVDAVMARGVTSSNAITPAFTGGAVGGPTHRVVMSKVSNISNASPDADGTAIPTGSNRTIGQLKFSGAAAANLRNGINRVALSTVEFEVDATNVALAANAFALYNKADPFNTASAYRLERLDGTTIPTTGTVTGVFRVIFTSLEQSAVDTAIDPGSDSTFVLRANVTNSKIDSTLASSLQTSLRPSRVRWLDQDNGSAVAFTGIEFPLPVVNSTAYRG